MQAREFLETRREMEALLREETIGYLGLAMDGAPYVVPLNYAYEGRDPGCGDDGQAGTGARAHLLEISS